MVRHLITDACTTLDRRFWLRHRKRNGCPLTMTLRHHRGINKISCDVLMKGQILIELMKMGGGGERR